MSEELEIGDRVRLARFLTDDPNDPKFHLHGTVVETTDADRGGSLWPCPTVQWDDGTRDTLFPSLFERPPILDLLAGL